MSSIFDHRNRKNFTVFSALGDLGRATQQGIKQKARNRKQLRRGRVVAVVKKRAVKKATTQNKTRAKKKKKPQPLQAIRFV